MTLRENLAAHIAIKAPCIWINTFEEARAVDIIYKAAEDAFSEEGRSFNVIEWSIAVGGKRINPVNRKPIASRRISSDSSLFGDEGMENDVDVLDRTTIPPVARSLFEYIKEYQEKGETEAPPLICIIKEFPDLSVNDELQRYVRDLREYPRKGSAYIAFIIISPTQDIPYRLQKLFSVMSLPLPSEDTIFNIVKAHSSVHNYMCDPAIAKNVAKAACGLTTIEIKRAFDLSFHKSHILDVDFINREKIQTIQKSGILTYKTPEQTLDSIGGHAKLKEWIRDAKDFLTDNAANFGVKGYRGFLALGPAGTGKTAIAEAIAAHFNVPFVKLDLSRIMGGIVGESERAARHAFEIIDSIGKCVVLLDEAEKQVGGKHILSSRVI